MHKEVIGQHEFTFAKSDANDASLEDIYRLRYQVYCKECNFLRAEDYPDGMEKDKYDPYSVHFVASDQNGAIGTSRLILYSELGFPLEEHCNGNLLVDKKTLPRHNAVEVSRLVISKEYRKRKDDGLYYGPDYVDNQRSEAEHMMKRIRPMAFGMYREMYQESKRRGITHWFAVMEKSLYLLLRMHNFVFHPIGKEFDYYGPVMPYLADIREMERTVHEKSPQLWAYFTEGLDPNLILSSHLAN